MSEDVPVGEETAVCAPCAAACPVHTDTRQFVEFIAQGRYEDALDLLLEANPFSSVCGRICHHPCEQSCRRAKVDAPVGLMRLKRFIVEATREHRLSRREGRKPVQDREKVAVIGAGPSGLTAAADLAQRGFRVTVFERSQTPGGMLGNAIPRYRLPYSVLSEDIEDILSLGMELKLGQEVGTDLMLEDLLGGGFSAVLMATGLSESRTLGVPGIDSRGIFLALPFLRAALSGQPPALGRKVVVIGGGNVAIDVARTARRLGAEGIHLVCLESREEMPAWEWEVEEAEQEGVRVMNSWGPADVFSDDGVVRGLELKRCLSVFDAEGRFNPAFDEGETATVAAHSVIIAIGQRGDLTCLEGSSVKVEGAGRMEWDPHTLCTSQRGVFACGEVVTGPGSAVEAVFDGHRAARAIAEYLETGQVPVQAPMEPPHLGDLPDDVADKVKVLDPVEVDVVAPEDRIRGFTETERGFSEAEALAEAKRCIACTTGALADEEKCAGCLTCVRVCPFGVATVEKTAVMPQEECQACGLCAAQCPAAAIALKRFGTDQMQEVLQQRVAEEASGSGLRPLIVSFCCLFEMTSRGFIRQAERELPQTGVVPVMVPCVARLSVADLLRPFEMGVEGVVVIGCSEGACLYPTAEDRIAGCVERVRDVLSEIGLEQERIDFWKTDGSAEVSWSAFWELSRRKLQRVRSAQKGEAK
ncbi:MAG: FAD-dependent oxidoreductase [Planctomycetota bacterium]